MDRWLSICFIILLLLRNWCDVVVGSRRLSLHDETNSSDSRLDLLERLSFPEKPTSKSCRLMSTQGERNVKVMVFIDSCYFNLYHNWQLHYVDVCGASMLNRLEIVCMDGDVPPMLEELGVKCSLYSFVMPFFHSYRKKQAAIWIKRLEVMGKLLENNVDLLLSDSDAIWRRDPFVELNKYVDFSHVISSRGNFPAHVYLKYGATLCMGFVYFKSTSFNVQLMKAVLMEMHNDRPDDQFAVNVVLDRWKLQWNQQVLDLSRNVVPHFGHVLNPANGYNVTLLPHDKFIRNCTRMSKELNVRLQNETIVRARHAVESAIVAHCVFTAGNAFTKYKSLDAYLLWHDSLARLQNDSIVPTAGCIAAEPNVTEWKAPPVLKPVIPFQPAYKMLPPPPPNSISVSSDVRLRDFKEIPGLKDRVRRAVKRHWKASAIAPAVASRIGLPEEVDNEHEDEFQ